MSKQKRILMLVYTYPPDDPRVMAEARSAVKLGYPVAVIGAAHYQGQPGQQHIDGIDIQILPVINRPGQFLRGLWHLIRGRVYDRMLTSPTRGSNPLSLLFFYLWILRLTLFRPYDLIHGHEHQAMPISWLLASIKSVRWIYDAHEHVPGNRRYFETGKARLAMSTEAFFLRRADATITVGNRLKRDLLERGAREVVIVGNWKLRDRYQIDESILDEQRRLYQLDRFSLIVVYFGVLNHERQVDVLVEAIAQAPDIGLLIAGRGDLHDAVVQQAAAYDNIIWLDWIAYEQVPIYTMLGDVVYACLKEVSGNPEYMAPNKLFDAFAAGKAIIATEGIGEMSEILQQYPAGIMLPEVDADSLLTALNSLKNRDTLQQLQANARLGYEEYNWLVAEGRLKELYGQLL